MKKSIASVILGLLSQQQIFAKEDYKEIFYKKYDSKVLDTVEKLESELSRFVPHILTVFSVPETNEVNYENVLNFMEENKLNEKMMKSNNLGFNSHIMFCSNSVKTTPQGKDFCQFVDKSDTYFIGMPFSRNIDIESKLSSNEFGIKLLEKSPEVSFDDDENELDDLRIEFFNSFDQAGKYVTRSLPHTLRAIPLTESMETNGQLISNFIQNELASKHHAMLFLSFSKDGTPKIPTSMKSLSLFSENLINIGHLHNPHPTIGQMLGINLSEDSTDSVLLFMFRDTTKQEGEKGSVATFMYDARVYGKFSAESMLTFLVNCFHQIVQGSGEEENRFNQWLGSGTSKYQLPMYLSFNPDAQKPSADNGANFQILQTAVTSERFKNSCFDGSLCVVGLFPTSVDFDTYEEEYVAKFQQIYDKLRQSVFSVSSAASNTVFMHTPSCKANQLLQDLDLSEYQLPTVVILRKGKGNTLLAENMLKAFNTANAVQFLRGGLKRALKDGGADFFTKQISYEDDTVFIARKCDEVVVDEPEEDMEEWLREIREEEAAEELKRKEEEKLESLRLKEEKAKAEEDQKKKTKKKKKKSKKKSKKSKTEL
eukprot:augustus_masked-scaffold_4-processed-gene-18.15-mRNA-1 protein AED:1.00 eAED:1.00 QI:0/-1/0/0/-1/1/1/0/596